MGFNSGFKGLRKGHRLRVVQNRVAEEDIWAQKERGNRTVKENV